MKKLSTLSERIEELLQKVSHEDIESLPENDPDGRCETCSGFGYVKTPRGIVACECTRRDVAQFEIAQARIPKRYEDVSLRTSEMLPDIREPYRKAREYVIKYSPKENKGLYIFGSTGSGKTHLGICILKALIEQGYDGVFYNVIDLLDEIRSTFNPDDLTNTKSRLEKDLQRQVLVLDDFGAQKTSAWVADRLYAIINKRYQDCKTLIITSNFKLEDLKMKTDSRLYSRMIEMLDPIEFKSNDFRRRKNIRGKL